MGAALRAYDAKHVAGYDRVAEPRLNEELARLVKKQKAAVDAEIECRMDDPSPERDARISLYREKQREIADKAEELRARLSAVQDAGKQHRKTLTAAEKIAVAVASVREALESEHLTPVEKNEILSNVVAALVCALGLALLAPTAQAQQKHDSNSLHKFGKAIEYPFRKASENTSVSIHRAEGRKSVVHRRNGNKTYRSVVTPKGHIHRLYRVGHHRRHARRHHRR